MALLTLDIDDTDVPLIRDMVHARTGNPAMTDPEVVTWLKGDIIQHVHMRVAEFQRRVADQELVIDLPIII